MQQELGPTPETKRRLKPDPILFLIKDEFLGSEHEAARDEIELGARVIQRVGGVGLKMQGYERKDRGYGLYVSERQAQAYQHYCDWHDRLHYAAKHDVIRATMDAVLEPVSLQDIETVLRIRHGTAKNLIREGLEIMADLMGLRIRRRAA